MHGFAQVTFQNWIRLLPLIAVVLAAIIFTINFTYQTKKRHNKELKELKTLILNNAKILAKDRVYIVLEMIKSIQKKNFDKSLEIQKQEIQEFVQSFQFSNNNYVRVLDTKGTIITHIVPSYVGKNLWDDQKMAFFIFKSLSKLVCKKMVVILTMKTVLVLKVIFLIKKCLLRQKLKI